jgi:hypothetical protein
LPAEGGRKYGNYGQRVFVSSSEMRVSWLESLVLDLWSCRNKSYAPQTAMLHDLAAAYCVVIAVGYRFRGIGVYGAHYAAYIVLGGYFCHHVVFDLADIGLGFSELNGNGVYFSAPGG